MKTEERHRLHEHELRKLTLKAGEFWKQHGLKVLAVLLGVGVIVIGALIWSLGSESAAAEGWTRMASSGNAEQFIAIAEDYAGQPVGAWARLRAAELHLQEGVRQSFSNRGAAVDELDEAVQQFAALLSADLPSDMLRERALFGHARALEAMAAIVEPSQGKVNATLDDAVAAYEKLLKTYPETLFKPIVDNQIKALQAERTRQFVTWFRQQDPRPADRELPQDGLPPATGGASQPSPFDIDPADVFRTPPATSAPAPDDPATPQKPPSESPDPSANETDAPAPAAPDTPPASRPAEPAEPAAAPTADPSPPPAASAPDDSAAGRP
ncbi:MAG TPA: hypothetical protein VML55_10585 [Planctomycetaceae bacterium]|nr:hypothetical protein [Planctomycetaceae bacterium]